MSVQGLLFVNKHNWLPVQGDKHTDRDIPFSRENVNSLGGLPHSRPHVGRCAWTKRKLEISNIMSVVYLYVFIPTISPFASVVECILHSLLKGHCKETKKTKCCFEGCADQRET